MLIKIYNCLIPRRLRALRRDQRGTILIEFAFTFPVIVMTLMLGFEVFQFMMVQRKTSQMVNSVNNLVSQNQQVANTDITDIFDAVDHIMSPFELGGNGQIIISQIAGTAGNPVVTTQCKYSSSDTLISKVGIEGANANLNTLPGTFTLADGEYSIVTEVYYHYTPNFLNLSADMGGGIFTEHNVYHVAAQEPRFGQVVFSNGCPTPL